MNFDCKGFSSKAIILEVCYYNKQGKVCTASW